MSAEQAATALCHHELRARRRSRMNRGLDESHNQDSKRARRLASRSRHVGVTVQDNIDIIRRKIRRIYVAAEISIHYA